MSFLEVVKHEIKQVGLVTLYFFTAFAVISVIMKLLLISYEIHLTLLSKVIIGALVMGKVVIILDKTSFGDRFANHARYLNILYKSIVYTFATFVVAALEKTYHYYHETHNVQTAFLEIFQDGRGERLAAFLILVFISFIFFNTMIAVNRTMNLKAFLLAGAKNEEAAD